MTKVPKFGFSAFLRISCMNERPQKTEVRKRYKPEKKKGYDFHRRFRRGIQSFANGSQDISGVMAGFLEIAEEPERKAALKGFKGLVEWLALNPGRITSAKPLTFDSPNRVYKVHFEPDFVLQMEQRTTAIHVWNTTKTELSRDVVQGALAMISKHWPDERDRPEDFAVLSLPNGRLYRWSDDQMRYGELGYHLLTNLEKLCVLAADYYSEHSKSEHERPHKSPRPKH